MDIEKRRMTTNKAQISLRCASLAVDIVSAQWLGAGSYS